jgi:hypothetical protein
MLGAYAVIAALLWGQAAAQTDSQQPVRVIVPCPPGQPLVMVKAANIERTLASLTDRAGAARAAA